jgi:hypothetical protein
MTAEEQLEHLKRRINSLWCQSDFCWQDTCAVCLLQQEICEHEYGYDGNWQCVKCSKMADSDPWAKESL